MQEKRKTALVSGASSGIGLELARVLAKAGYDLVLVARSRERLQTLSGELEGQYQVKVRIIPVDLSQSGAALAVYDQTGNTAIDVLVNNAGFGVHGDFVESDGAAEQGMLQVNVLALTELTKLYLPAMKQRGSGKILNVASTGAFQPVPGMAVYGATKAYVLSFTEALAVELRGSGVSATVLCPGATRTAFAERAAVTDIPLFQRGVMDAATVAASAYAGMQAGRTVVIPGWLNRVMAVMSKLSPRSLVARISYALVTPGKQ